MTAILQLPFGTFQGKQSDGITQYLGIKYASVKDQLSPPELVTDYGDVVVDATHFGPRAPAIDGCSFEQEHLIQCNTNAQEETPNMSGTECLNLNITVPKMELGDRKIPVMVFIHGGGLIMGANYWPQYDPSLLVKMSGEMDMPVIAVNINYRLGILGNLASQELHDAGYMGNNSLRDQKCALQWIKRHIAAFGGDEDNVTVFGESAGASSVLYQLHSKEPMFKRCISMSGTPLMLRPLPLPVAETSYASIVQAFGLENASTSERVQRLRTVSPEDLVANTALSVPLLPVLDGDILPEATTFAKLASHDHASLPGMQWCESLMIGDCQHDGTVFFFMGLSQRKDGIATALTTFLHANLATSATQSVLEAYSITASTEDTDALKCIMELATDIAYIAPALAWARSFPGKSYYYQFNEPNPWDGMFKGHSTHMLDAAFLFQHFNDELSPEALEVATTLAQDFVRFANGVEPWSEFDEKMGMVRTYGPGKIGIIGNNGWESGRRDVLWKLSEEGKVDLDDLIGAWHMFIAGK
ncbi:hypothetical protein HBI33_223380 [Parastagonospora nodorum]|nr:hypothetical protein HBI33_223380 [Parastagonospora nodorum]